MKLKDMVIGILFFALVMLLLQSQMLFAVNDPTNRATFAPWTNGGKNEDVSSTVIGPVINGTTWKFTKTGPNPQWNGWEATYGGIFNCNAGEYWTISGYYKTCSPAGITNLTVGAFYKPDWSAPYNSTVIDSYTTIIPDGNWHFFYCTIRLNENMTNGIIADGPSWNYSTQAGVLYINGLQWTKTNYVVPNPSLPNLYTSISPWTNGGANYDVTGTSPGPVPNSKTWQFVKTGPNPQWNGWEAAYGGIFIAAVGETWTIAGYYKTSSPAGLSNLTMGAIYKPDWSGPYNTTVLDSKTDIIADGNWHYFYCTMRANEPIANGIIADGPSWNYSTQAGTLYINGLQWLRSPYTIARTYPKNDFNRDNKSEIPILSNWGMAVVNYSAGQLSQNNIASNGTRFGGWSFNTADNHFGPIEDYDGDGAAEFLVTSPWGMGFLKQTLSTISCPMLAANGTRAGDWVLNTADNHFDAVGNFDGVAGKEILVTSPWGIGFLKLTGSTLSCPVAASNYTRIGGWVLNTADNHFGPVGDFDKDGKEEFVITSPWGMGIFKLSGNTIICVMMAANGTYLGGWNLDTAVDRFGPVGDFDGDGQAEILITSPTNLGILKLYSSSLSSVVNVTNGTRLGSWNLNTGDNSFGPVGYFSSISKAQIVVSSPWGIGILELTGNTLSAPVMAASGNVYGSWRLNTADNRINIAGDFDNDLNDELLVTSPWGVGILKSSGSSITSITALPNHTFIGDWHLNTADNDLEVGNWNAYSLLIYHNDWSGAVNDIAAKIKARGHVVDITDNATVGLQKLNSYAVNLKKGDRFFVYLAGHGSNPRSSHGDVSKATSLNHFNQFNAGDLYLSQTASLYTKIANAGVDLTVFDGGCNGGETVYYAMGEKYCAVSTVGVLAPGLTGFPNMGDVLADEKVPSSFGFWTSPHLMGSLLNGIIVKNASLRTGQRLYRNDDNDFNKNSVFFRSWMDLYGHLDAGGYWMLISHSTLYKTIYPDQYNAMTAADQATFTNANFVNDTQAWVLGAETVLNTNLLNYMDNADLVSKSEPIYQARLKTAWQTLAHDMAWDPVADPAKHASGMNNLSAAPFTGSSGFAAIVNQVKTNFAEMRKYWQQQDSLLRKISSSTTPSASDIAQFKAISVDYNGYLARTSMLFSIIEDAFNVVLANGKTYPGDVNLY